MGAYNCEGAHAGDVELSLRKSPNKKLSLKNELEVDSNSFFDYW